MRCEIPSIDRRRSLKRRGPAPSIPTMSTLHLSPTRLSTSRVARQRSGLCLVLRPRSRNPWSRDERLACVRPREWPCFAVVPVGREGGDDVIECVEAPDGSPSERLAPQNPEPDFDLIQPAAVERREDEARAWMTLEPRAGRLAATSVDVVGDHDDRPSSIVPDDAVEESNHVGRGAILGDVDKHVHGLHVERGEDIARAVALVLELDARDESAFRRKGRVLPRNRLHAGLLVDTQHHGRWRRRHVEFADSRRLLVEIRIGGIQPVFHPMRLQGDRSKEPADRRSTHRPAVFRTEEQREVAHRPAREWQAELRWRLDDKCGHLLPYLPGNGRWSSAPTSVLETIEPAQKKALSPTPNDLSVERERRSHGFDTHALRREQDHLRSDYQPGGRLAPPHDCLQPLARLPLQLYLGLRYCPPHLPPLFGRVWVQQPQH